MDPSFAVVSSTSEITSGGEVGMEICMLPVPTLAPAPVITPETVSEMRPFLKAVACAETIQQYIDE